MASQEASQKASQEVFRCEKGISMEQCIYAFLDKNKFAFRYIKPDGDSFFNSLIQSRVFSRNTTVLGLRYALVKYLKESGAVANLENAGISGNVNELKKQGVWVGASVNKQGEDAGHIISRYASVVFRIHLIIYDVRKDEPTDEPADERKDERNDNTTVLIETKSFSHANPRTVHLLRTGNNHYSLLLPPQLPPQPSNSNMLNTSTVNLLHMAPNLPNPSARPMRTAPGNTGTSTFEGYRIALPEPEYLLNEKVVSHSELGQKLWEMLREPYQDRDEVIMMFTSKGPWYIVLHQMMTTRAPKKPHKTLLELCETYPMHRCLRAIHHYFGEFMDHCHDWKKITWCVLPESLEDDIKELNSMVDKLDPKYTKKDNLKEWIQKWKKVAEIRSGEGINETKCREYIIELNEEYVRRVNDPEIMVNEPLAYWLPANLNHTVQKSWEFNSKDPVELKDEMNKMKTYLEDKGIRILYFESGANWMEHVVKIPRKIQGNTRMTLDQILNGNELVSLGISPHASYNAAPCGVTLCSAKAGPCKKTCSIPLEIKGMDILGAQVDVIIKGNPTGVDLTGLTQDHARDLQEKGGILIRKKGFEMRGKTKIPVGCYIFLPGNPVELSLNALSKIIEDSIGTYRRGKANNSAIADLEFIYSDGIPSYFKAQLLTVLKTWTDAIQMRGISALKMEIMKAYRHYANCIAAIVLDNMFMALAATEDVPFVLFSSSIRSPKDALTAEPTRHRYTLHCFDNTAIAANEAGIFDKKTVTFAWTCDKAITGELRRMLDALLNNKKEQLSRVADSVADPTLFFACYQMIESIATHRHLAHSQCDQIRSLAERIRDLAHNKKLPDNATKRVIENAIETSPLTPSDTLENFASLQALADNFNKNVEELNKTRFGLHVVANYTMFLESYTAARQDVRNSGVTNIEHEIELYAVCMMATEYVRTNYKDAIKHLINIQTKAFDMIMIDYLIWEDETYPSSNNDLRKLQLQSKSFIEAWTVTEGNIRERTQKILQQIHNPTSMKTIGKMGNITNVPKKTIYATEREGFAVVIKNTDFKDIMKASTMCLYILHNMTNPSSKLAYEKLNETYNANMTVYERKEDTKELANTGVLPRFKSYYEQLQEQKKTFTLRTVGVSFKSFVEACLNDPNLYCAECPKERECVVCTGSSCRVVGHPLRYSVLGRRSSSNASNSNDNNNTSPSAKRPKSRPTPSSAMSTAPPNGTASAAATQRAATQQASSAAAAMNTSGITGFSSKKSPPKKGGTRKRARKTRVKRQRKRQTRNRKARKTRKN